MIRRISANNDYRDIIRSCPSGVVDDIYEVEYYVDGYSNVYSASFSKKGSLLEVIIPSSALQTLPSGLLMRRAKYRNEDPSFPDGNYDLEFVEDMNVWLESGSGEPGPGPVPGEYVTEEELAETLEDYVTQDSLAGTLNDYATETELQTVQQGIAVGLQNLDNRVTALEQNPGGVSQEQFDVHVAENAAQFSGIDQSLGNLSQGVQQAQDTASSAASQAAQAHQRALQAIQANAAQDTRMDAIDAKNAAQDASIEIQGITLDSHSQIIDGLDQRVTDLEQGGVGGGSWGSITGDINDQQDLMDEFDADRSRLDDLENGTVVPTGTATESWVQNQGYASDTDLDSLESRVSVLEHGGSPVTLSWGGITGTITDQRDLVNYVDQAIEDAISGSDIPLPENVVEYDVNHPLIEDFGLNVDVLKRNEFDHGTDVITKGLVLGYEEIKDNGDITDINTIEIRNGLLQSVSYSFDGVDYHESRDPYAMESWVQNQGYITSSALSGYATESWATNQFLEESKVWTGTETQWNQLSVAQKASYTIALITQ